MPQMRAKLRLHHIDKHGTPWPGATASETLHFHAVAASKYPEDGSDENNTYAKFSPSAVLNINVTNPDLVGKFEPGTEFYVDFTPAI